MSDCQPRVLLVGGAGYIGAHVAMSLRRSGVSPVILDDFSTGSRSSANDFETFEGDFADPIILAQALKSVDVVMHFAAKAYVGESITEPHKYYTCNVAKSISLLGECLDRGINKFIFSSSCAVYGDQGQLPIRESAHRLPLSPYGHTKAVIEDVLLQYALAYDLNSVTLRYFNVAGADPTGLIGEEHDPETHLIPSILRVAAGLSREVTIFGCDHETQDGSCIRDYVHVDDIARAHIDALKYLRSGQSSAIINLGTGIGISVLDVILEAEKITGRSIARVFQSRRTGDPSVVIGDITLASLKLDWAPRKNLTDMIRTAWSWQASTLSSCKYQRNDVGTQ